MVYIGNILDPSERARLEALEQREFRNAEYMAQKERNAATGNQAPEVIQPGDRDHVSQMSWDLSAGWEARKYRQLRAKRSSGKAHMPQQIINHGTHLEAVYETEVDLEPFKNGDCCMKCKQWQPEDEVVLREKHRRLADVLGYEIPRGKTMRDCCCYCGFLLDSQRFAA